MENLSETFAQFFFMLTCLSRILLSQTYAHFVLTCIYINIHKPCTSETTEKTVPSYLQRLPREEAREGRSSPTFSTCENVNSWK